MIGMSMDSGVLYVGPPGGELHPLGECEENDLCEAVENKDIPRINDILTGSEVTISITLTQEQVDEFFNLLYSTRAYAIDMVRILGYPRIAHLESHSKKWRVRKKNLFRAYRICLKEG